MEQPAKSPTSPSFIEALRFWIKLGLISFGGPAAQIAIMHREIVDRKKWMDDRHFFNGLNFCMMLPGPEAQQLATYLGWRLHGLGGGIAAGALFVLPSAVLLFGLSWLYILGDSIPVIPMIFHGLLGAVIALVLDAVLRIGGRVLRTPALVALAVASFAAIYFFNVGFVWIVASAAILGSGGNWILPKWFPASQGHHPAGKGAGAAVTLRAVPVNVWKRSIVLIGTGLFLWWAPVFLLAWTLGWGATPVQQGLFFSKAALVTFGGAYAVLPYVAQQAVESRQWLSPTQMMAGLALAETTPGPLIMVLQFVGFVGSWQHPGVLDPRLAALAGSAITTWVTFLPGFIFVFLAGPWIEKIDSFPTLGSALTAITAAVTGVILNLGISFSRSALFPEQGAMDFFTALIAIASFVAFRKFQVPILPVLAVCALAGILRGFVVG